MTNVDEPGRRPAERGETSWGIIAGVTGILAVILALIALLYDRADASEAKKETERQRAERSTTTLPSAVTELTVDPTTVDAPANQLPELTITVTRRNQDLVGANVLVGDDVCRAAVSIEAGDTMTTTCPLPPVEPSEAPTTVVVTVTAPDGTDESKSVPVTAGDDRCAPPQTQDESIQPMLREDFVARWNTATSAAAPTDCPPEVEGWAFPAEPTDGLNVDGSTVRLTFGKDAATDASNIETMAIRLNSSAPVDQLVWSAASTFANSADELDDLVADGLNRPCGGKVAYALAMSKVAGVTTITAEAC